MIPTSMAALSSASDVSSPRSGYRYGVHAKRRSTKRRPSSPCICRELWNPSSCAHLGKRASAGARVPPRPPRTHSQQQRCSHEGFSDEEAAGRRSRAHSAVASSNQSHANSTTIRGQFYEVAKEYAIPVYSGGGWDSISFKHNTADEAVAEYLDTGRQTVVLHAGGLRPRRHGPLPDLYGGCARLRRGPRRGPRRGHRLQAGDVAPRTDRGEQEDSLWPRAAEEQELPWPALAPRLQGRVASPEPPRPAGDHARGYRPRSGPRSTRARP